MPKTATTLALSEEEFAALVDALAADPNRRAQLTDLLREDHPFYDQRGAATIVEMRGWALLAVARVGVSDDSLVFVLEELDAGVDPYLVAAAAYALRSYPNPNPALAPFVMRALTQIRYHDEPVSFQAYADYAVSSTGTSPVRELLITLAWLGPHARGVLPEIEAVAKSGGLSKKASLEAHRALEAIRGAAQAEQLDGATCCTLPGGLFSKFSWSRNSRRGSEPIESTVFEDQEGALITFKEFFAGHPSIVVFFYTRCDNPLKCSLTVTKLARVQKLLEVQGLADQIHTAAITYDPAFDLSKRIRGYGQNRGVRLDACHRMLRTTDGINALRSHFKLGVNFIESLVNRHRIELYILDSEERIAASFERLHWDEQEVVNRAIEVLREKSDETRYRCGTGVPAVTTWYANLKPGYTGGTPVPPAEVVPQLVDPPARRKRVLPMFGTLASLGVAFFPKCPICWAAYLSVFGIAGLNQIPYSPWLYPVLFAVMLINLASVWLRGRRTGRMSAFYLVSAGALAIVLSKISAGWAGAAAWQSAAPWESAATWKSAAAWGVALTLAGSLLNALNTTTTRRRPLTELPGQVRRLFQYLSGKETVMR